MEELRLREELEQLREKNSVLEAMLGVCKATKTITCNVHYLQKEIPLNPRRLGVTPLPTSEPLNGATVKRVRDVYWRSEVQRLVKICNEELIPKVRV